MVDLHGHMHFPEISNDGSTDDAFDLMGDDPLEWLIETDCTQHYLPESSLPLFPFTMKDDKLVIDDDDSHHDNLSSLHDSADMQQLDMVQDAILHNMVDPNVTMQSLFLPTEDIMSEQ
jgi:hypothetical protein